MLSTDHGISDGPFPVYKADLAYHYHIIIVTLCYDADSISNYENEMLFLMLLALISLQMVSIQSSLLVIFQRWFNFGHEICRFNWCSIISVSVSPLTKYAIYFNPFNRFSVYSVPDHAGVTHIQHDRESRGVDDDAESALRDITGWRHVVIQWQESTDPSGGVGRVYLIDLHLLQHALCGQ